MVRIEPTGPPLAHEKTGEDAIRMLGSFWEAFNLGQEVPWLHFDGDRIYPDWDHCFAVPEGPDQIHAAIEVARRRLYGEE